MEFCFWCGEEINEYRSSPDGLLVRLLLDDTGIVKPVHMTCIHKKLEDLEKERTARAIIEGQLIKISKLKGVDELRKRAFELETELAAIKEGIKNNTSTMIIDGGDMIDWGWLSSTDFVNERRDFHRAVKPFIKANSPVDINEDDLKILKSFCKDVQDQKWRFPYGNVEGDLFAPTI